MNEDEVISGFRITTHQAMDVLEDRGPFNLISSDLDEIAILIAGGETDFEVWACDVCRPALTEDDRDVIQNVFNRYGVTIEMEFAEVLYE